ncbi:MAG: DEAD/DEAH box helicase [Myxococcota bacterium]|nr:DEAD/DEAH box helicase [Myxococcota bacterium]
MMAEEVTAVEAEVEDSSAPAEAVETTEVQAEEAPAEQKLELSDKAFSEFGLGEALCTSLKEQGFERPTIVQAEAMEPMLARKDLIVQSKTGSGKTLAFGVPLLERYQGSESESKKPRAIILAPTRELAHQVSTELRKIGEPLGVRVFAVYGGVSIGRQVAVLKSGIDILVATPGRLLDHLRRENVMLDAIECCILDEADEMLSMGFWDDVTSLMDKLDDSAQRLLFSATLPYQIAKAASKYLREPARLDVSGDVLTVDGIDNFYVTVASDRPKPRQLLYVLEHARPSSAIVFCNTRSETETIAKYLCQNGFVAEALSGGFRQSEREKVVERIKSGELRYMVATDIAARGIDIAHLSHVVNYALPEFSEVYLHRVGRTGRAGRSGTAISLVDGKGLGTYTVLEREFDVKFKKMELPDEAEILASRSERIMKELLEKAEIAEVGQHLSTAEDILKHDSSQNVVAFLLKSYFSQQAEKVDESAKQEERKARRQPQEGEEQDGDRKRSRRRRRRRKGKGGDEKAASGAEQNDSDDSTPPPAVQEGLRRVQVNIGFDDGFKGRGAVAKKITALAGLNDGIVSELEAKRHHAVLAATPEVAEMLVDRVDGAMLGRKTIEISVTD